MMQRIALVGIELAIGMDLHGERFCYVAGCAYGGITFGDAGYGGTAGIQVTGYNSISLGASFDVVGGGARRAREQWRAFGTARCHP